MNTPHFLMLSRSRRSTKYGRGMSTSVQAKATANGAGTIPFTLKRNRL